MVLFFETSYPSGDSIPLGNIVGKALETPGHTPACMTYSFGDSLFVGKKK
jgi:glyoxylase-like metal-dependent hydrolase (beta-lactamase superfamily II)